jgi:CheY-like chemotaxis protein/HPt (histidine-containing phosphotransfer) domain-containing protein
MFVKPNPIQGKLAGLTILVVEDGADNQRIFRYFLKMAGADFTLVEDGPSALERALHDEALDLVLMDIQIPGMDGYEVTERLRQSGFTRPIIAVTAHALETEQARGTRVGITDFLTKPFEIEKLVQIILKHTRSVPAAAARPASPSDSGVAASLMDAASNSHAFLQSKYHDKPMYRPIIIDFVNTFQKRLETMQNLIDSMNWEQLAVIMHQVKGAAATYGYPQVSDGASQLEVLAKDAKRDAYAVDTIRRKAEEMHRMGRGMQVGLEGVEHRV